MTSAAGTVPLAELTATLARSLAVPPAPAGDTAGQAQSLADGPPGIALLHIERAHTGADGWHTPHGWLESATSAPINAADQASLFTGAPAIAFALHAAARGQPSRYAQPRAALDRAVNALAHRRVEQAIARITRADLPTFTEYDIISGLTGIGAHLLSHTPGDDALGRILTYLVRLTEPIHVDGDHLPGWWTGHDPHLNTSPAFPGGHGNLGMAHGIAGPLALLSLAWRRGITVSGHLAAMETICVWLDTWHQDGDAGHWWPQWITRSDLKAGRAHQPVLPRASWCYGTPGLARAQQLAGLATGDTARQQYAEAALIGCLEDPSQLGGVLEPGLCHGWAGLFQTSWRILSETQPASDPTTLTGLLVQPAPLPPHTEAGLLNGRAGLALAAHTAVTDTAPLSGWDSCLLIA